MQTSPASQSTVRQRADDRMFLIIDRLTAEEERRRKQTQLDQFYNKRGISNKLRKDRPRSKKRGMEVKVTINEPEEIMLSETEDEKEVTPTLLSPPPNVREATPPPSPFQSFINAIERWGGAKPDEVMPASPKTPEPRSSPGETKAPKMSPPSAPKKKQRSRASRMRERAELESFRDWCWETRAKEVQRSMHE